MKINSPVTTSQSFNASAQVKLSSALRITEQEVPTNNALNSKQLQPDTLDISEESQEKALAEESTTKPKELMSETEVEQSTEGEESQLDKEIRALSVEIMEISIQIELLKTKEDTESKEELNALEVELEIKKGVLKAKIEQKLDLAALSS